MTLTGRPIAFVNWNNLASLEFVTAGGHFQFELTREQLDGLIVKLQQLSADMRTREPRA